MLPKGITNRGYALRARLTYNGTTKSKDFRFDIFLTFENTKQQAITWLNSQKLLLDTTEAGKTSKFKQKVKELTQALLKEYLQYDPETGIFTWVKTEAVCLTIGMVAGGFDTKGYVIINLLGKPYKAHRLAWLYTYGYLPDKAIDHKNGIASDNRIANLRLASFADNCANSSRVTSNTGVKGVYGSYKAGRSSL
jgi:hypothetical protein